MLAYASDLTLLGVSLVPHGVLDRLAADAAGVARPLDVVPPAVPRRPVAALRPALAVGVSGARGFAIGRVFSRDGRLVASVAQEGLIRPLGEARERSVVRYGFAIDHRTCIGCHACTVACKTEHQIPVGQFRTWVKYVDSGTFPDSTRDFGVMRCNHCTDAPCVEICPTSSLFKRDDGIVDFDSEICIGCKSCMQACPYDAIYIDKDTNTAAKCNFCAHRVDNGLEPACVTVCPTHSIWVGDLDDPTVGSASCSRRTRRRSAHRSSAPGPTCTTSGRATLVLDPLAAPVRDTYIWSQPDDLRLLMAEDPYGADPTAATTLNTAHPRPWGWRVATYLWTKGLGAGRAAGHGARGAVRHRSGRADPARPVARGRRVRPSPAACWSGT